MALELVKMLAVLAAILALIFGIAWMFRRLNLGGSGADGNSEGWRIVAVRALGPRRHVYVLEIGSRLLIVGACDRTLVPLMQIDDPAEREKLLDALTKKKRSFPPFQDFLRKAQS
jgi:flagellar biogenesis protein FliO